MDKTKTAVILGIIAIAMLGIIIWLNRDKFGSKEETTTTVTTKE